MAEALGVAASIAGLITIADIVVRRGYEFIKLVKGAGETVEKVMFGRAKELLFQQMSQGTQNEVSSPPEKASTVGAVDMGILYRCTGVGASRRAIKAFCT